MTNEKVLEFLQINGDSVICGRGQDAQGVFEFCGLIQSVERVGASCAADHTSPAVKANELFELRVKAINGDLIEKISLNDISEVSLPTDPAVGFSDLYGMPVVIRRL